MTELTDKAKHRLVDLKIVEVSGVDQAANRRRFLVVKQAEGGGDMGEVVRAEATAAPEAADAEGQRGWRARVAAGLCALFKADGQTFAENVAQRQFEERMWDAGHALQEAIRNTLQAPELEPAARLLQVGQSLSQFQEYVLGLVSAALGNPPRPAELFKVGAKLSASRRAKLQAAYAAIGEILREVTVEKEEEVTPMSSEQLAQLTELAKRLEAAEGALQQLAQLAELSKQAGILAEQGSTLAKRLEALEARAGVRKSADGQDPAPGEGKKSIFHGIL